MRRRAVRTAAGLAVALAAIAAALVPAMASAQPMDTAQPASPCGFYTQYQGGVDVGYYHNCSGSSAYIEIDIPFWPDSYACLNGYQTKELGTYPDSVRGARLLGAICPA